MLLELDGGLVCGTCISAWRKNSQTAPKCFRLPCSSSELMTDDLNAWMGLYQLMQSETIKGAVGAIIKAAKLSSADLDLIAMLDGTVAKWRRDKAGA